MSLRPSGDYLLLVDGSSFIHRNYHALPRLTRQSDGMQTGALYGFCNSMLKMFRLNWTAIDALPRYGAVVLDHRGKNWRHNIFPDYKGNRKGYDADLEVQLPHIPTIAEAFRVPCICIPGYEADDVIATYCAAAEESGLDVVIASSDKDLMQLVAEDKLGRTIMYDGMKDKGRDDCAGALVGEQQVYAKLGVWPHQVGDFLAITGDSVDNVPGVPGIGQKGAAKLLAKFGDLDRIFAEAAWGPDEFHTAKEHEKILTHMSDIRISRELVRLDYAVPIELSIDDLHLKPAASHTLRGLMMDFEFMSLVDKVDRPARL